mgnify:CR=1 FL=1
MRKSDKKTDNQIRLFLTDICEDFMKDFDGFLWLTHEADYDNFPQSLRISFVFNSQAHLDGFLASDGYPQLTAKLEKQLSQMKIRFKRLEDQMAFTVEQ